VSTTTKRPFLLYVLSGRTGQVWIFWEILSILQKMTQLWPHIYVDVSMKKFVSLRKLAETKKDARLTIRIPKELKNRIDGIDKLYGVALPKIANECLKAFCEYVEQKKQTPTFPLSIGSSLSSDKTRSHISIRRRRGFHDGHRQRR
jgi:hypothetical protein